LDFRASVFSEAKLGEHKIVKGSNWRICLWKKN